jgi:tRNA (guanine-N7-)-methyltransferase
MEGGYKMIERPDNRSYKLRGERQTLAQENAYKRSWPIFGLAPIGKINPAALFPESMEQIMEIGTGMGEGTAQIAAAFPEIGFIGVEVHKPGIGALLGHMERLQVSNLRIIEEDAHIILQENLPDKSLDAFHLFFPDPWPKRRHFKRRIIQPEFLELIHGKLKDVGYIHIATDWVAYALWIQTIFEASLLFEGGVIERPDWRPLTKFEGQGLRKGHVVTDLKYFKRALPKRP